MVFWADVRWRQFLSGRRFVTPIQHSRNFNRLMKSCKIKESHSRGQIFIFFCFKLISVQTLVIEKGDIFEKSDVFWYKFSNNSITPCKQSNELELLRRILYFFDRKNVVISPNFPIFCYWGRNFTTGQFCFQTHGFSWSHRLCESGNEKCHAIMLRTFRPGRCKQFLPCSVFTNSSSVFKNGWEGR